MFQSIFRFSFSPNVLMTIWFGSSTPSVICRLPPFLTSAVHFSLPNSIPLSDSQNVLGVSNTFFLAKKFDVLHAH